MIASAVLIAPTPVSSLAAATLITFVVVDAHFFFSGRAALGHLTAAVVGITLALLLSGVGPGTAFGFDLVLASIGIVIQQLVSLASDASRDALTGLHNRRGFDQALEELMAEASRSGEPLSAVLIDVDHFKTVNDTHGHEEGDRVLRRVADDWRGELPAGALLARHGGDEFSLLLPGRTGRRRSPSSAGSARCTTGCRCPAASPSTARATAPRSSCAAPTAPSTTPRSSAGAGPSWSAPTPAAPAAGFRSPADPQGTTTARPRSVPSCIRR